MFICDLSVSKTLFWFTLLSIFKQRLSIEYQLMESCRSWYRIGWSHKSVEDGRTPKKDQEGMSDSGVYHGIPEQK